MFPASNCFNYLSYFCSPKDFHFHRLSKSKSLSPCLFACSCQHVNFKRCSIVAMEIQKHSRRVHVSRRVLRSLAWLCHLVATQADVVFRSDTFPLMFASISFVESLACLAKRQTPEIMSRKPSLLFRTTIGPLKCS